MKIPALLTSLFTTAFLATAATPASAQIGLDVSGGIVGETLICDLSGTVPASEFVILTFSDTTGPLPVSVVIPGELGFWDQDLTMFSYPAFLQGSAYTNPLGNIDLSLLPPTLVGATVFGQAWTTGLGTPFLNLKSNVITVILGVHGMSTPTLLPPLSPHAYFGCIGLNDGNVLCVGGADSLGGTGTGSAEVYDYKTSTFSLTTGQPVNGPRATSASVKLSDGRVLVCGGVDALGAIGAAAELYDPVTNTFSATGSMNTPRALHTATLLNDGRVYVCGGSTSVSGADPVAQLLSVVSSATAAAEIYNPATGLWTNVASMAAKRTGHVANLLSDGRVLIAGGVNTNFLGLPVFLTSATRYNAPTNAYVATATMGGGGRALSISTILANGRVLVSGGLNADLLTQSVTAVNAVSIYDNTTNTWQNGPNMLAGRYAHTATLLPDGEVLVAGGVTGTASATTAATTLASCEGYTTINTWVARPNMLQQRAAHGAVLTKDGKRIVIVGGAGDFGLIDPGTSELYVP
ncbi:MAG: Kelch repeat-containing protein [Planctomycetota bacterium]